MNKITEIKNIDNKILALLKERANLYQETNLKVEKMSLDLRINNPNLTSYVNEVFDSLDSASKRLNSKGNKFLKRTAIVTEIVDPVFAVAKLAKNDSSGDTVNATIGALFDEDDKLVAFDSVYSVFNNLENNLKASYAQSFVGNDDFIRTVEKWVLPGSVTSYRKTIATAGGTGAISLAIGNTLDYGETLILPSIAWTSYKLMAAEYGLKTMEYQLFDSAGNFSLDSLKNCIINVSEIQQRVVLVINDPAQNPSGYSMTYEQWSELMELINLLDKEVILVNDIAYCDYANDMIESKKYFDLFNNLSFNTLVIIAFSCSKTMTMYGMRTGAALVLGQKDSVDRVMIVLEREARSLWSNINNGAMHTFVRVINNHYQDFIDEKKYYVELIKKRADLFMSQADEVGLKYYPYKEGFFVTVICPDNEYRDKFNKELIKDHIYTVVVDKGIRVAICGLSTKKIDKLAYRMMDVKNRI